jgi:hypothetical protein
MGGDQTPFFNLIEKLVEHIVKIEPRVQELEYKTRVMWCILVLGSGSLIVLIIVPLLLEWLKKTWIG